MAIDRAMPVVAAKAASEMMRRKLVMAPTVYHVYTHEVELAHENGPEPPMAPGQTDLRFLGPPYWIVMRNTSDTAAPPSTVSIM